MFFKKTYIVGLEDIKTRKEFIVELKVRNKDDIYTHFKNKYNIKQIHLKQSKLEFLLEELKHKNVTEGDIISLLRFIAISLKRGVRFQKALEFLLVSETNKSKQFVIKKLLKRIKKQFVSYYDIFKDFPEYFDFTFLWVVKAWESSGNLAENILKYIEEREGRIKQQQEVKNILIKRSVLLIAVLLVATVIIAFVIPQFEKLFKDGTSPALLSILGNIAHVLKTYWLVMLLLITALVSSFMFILKQNYKFRKQVELFVLKTPLVWDILRTYYTSQYLYYTWTLLIKRVNYLKIMDILIWQTKNIPFKEVFELIKENLIKGITLQTMLKDSEDKKEVNYKKIPNNLLLPSLFQAIEMGAVTGNMWEIMYDAFLSYNEVLQQKIKLWIKIFDKVFYSFIILLMVFLFLAMGSSMLALYKNAGNMI